MRPKKQKNKTKQNPEVSNVTGAKWARRHIITISSSGEESAAFRGEGWLRGLIMDLLQHSHTCCFNPDGTKESCSTSQSLASTHKCARARCV